VWWILVTSLCLLSCFHINQSLCYFLPNYIIFLHFGLWVTITYQFSLLTLCDIFYTFRFNCYFLSLSTTRELGSNLRIWSLVLIQIHYNNGNLQCNKDLATRWRQYKWQANMEWNLKNVQRNQKFCRMIDKSQNDWVTVTRHNEIRNFAEWLTNHKMTEYCSKNDRLTITHDEISKWLMKSHKIIDEISKWPSHCSKMTESL
jgi:hypothetical protein